MILAKIQADSVEDSLLFYSCQSLDGEGDFVSLAIRFAILCVHIIIIIIIIIINITIIIIINSSSDENCTFLS